MTTHYPMVLEHEPNGAPPIQPLGLYGMSGTEADGALRPVAPSEKLRNG
jgi:hypothetical protein